jgi:hypothetical protein
MNSIGLRLIFGACDKYRTWIFVLAFAVLLSTQQVASLLGVLQRATGLLQNIGVADLWVVASETYSVDYLREMPAKELVHDPL